MPGKNGTGPKGQGSRKGRDRGQGGGYGAGPMQAAAGRRHGLIQSSKPAFRFFSQFINGRVNHHQSNAISVFHTSQTLPTRAGPGFKVTLPGFHPEGVASVPLLLRTCWKA